MSGHWVSVLPYKRGNTRWDLSFGKFYKLNLDVWRPIGNNEVLINESVPFDYLLALMDVFWTSIFWILLFFIEILFPWQASMLSLPLPAIFNKSSLLSQKKFNHMDGIRRSNTWSIGSLHPHDGHISNTFSRTKKCECRTCFSLVGTMRPLLQRRWIINRILPIFCNRGRSWRVEQFHTKATSAQGNERSEWVQLAIPYITLCIWMF